MTEKHLLYENLREKCIYEIVGDKPDQNDGHTFFNYIYWMHVQCLSGSGTLSEACANKVMDKLDIPVEEVNACINESFVETGDFDSYNRLLGADREFANHSGSNMSPSVTIDGKPYLGKFKADDIYEAVCKSYHPLR